MGRLARLLSFIPLERNGAKVSDAKVDTGGGANVTAQHSAPPGDDSQPLPGDLAVLSHDTGTGRETVTGYIDTANSQKAQAGEKRIYARDENGAEIAEVWIKNTGEVKVITPNSSFTAAADGSIIGQNSNGAFELQSGGNFEVNGVTIDTDGNITTPGKVEADDVTATSADVTLSTHEHNNGSVAAPDPGT